MLPLACVSVCITMDGDEFKRQLRQLVEAAQKDDVSLPGCYDVQSSETHDRRLQIEITEVADYNRLRALSND